MATIKYTSDVGMKFNEDGSVRDFPGNSIISFVEPDSDIFKWTTWLQGQLRQQSFSHKYAMLPPDSFHMTVIDLICDQVRNANNWSAHLTVDTELEIVDNYFLEQTEHLHIPSSFRMQFAGISPRGVSVYLNPANERTGKSLHHFRSSVAEATGVQHPNHDTYQFHVSLAYLLMELNDDESKQLKEFLNRTTATLRQSLSEIVVSSPQLVFFDNMFRFVPANQRNTLTSRKSSV